MKDGMEKVLNVLGDKISQVESSSSWTERRLKESEAEVVKLKQEISRLESDADLQDKEIKRLKNVISMIEAYQKKHSSSSLEVADIDTVIKGVEKNISRGSKTAIKKGVSQ